MIMRPALTFSIILLSLACASAAWSGTVYRWVDKDGNVQFSETPPTGQASEATRYRTRTDSPTPSPAPTRPQQSPQDAPADQPETGSEPAPDNAAKEALARHHKQNCEIARENLQNMRNHARIQVEENGERRFLSPEEIEERRALSEQVKEESCNWSPD